ncbi:MAG: hypothetical protein LBQ42_04275 [Synergistaceae bacterium]|jgi:hypothetical protein|nr:hypothetical protein [Synergistaceae bacterium]
MILETTRALVQLFKTVEPNTHLSQGSIVELAELPAVILSGPVAQEVSLRQRDGERITAIDKESGIAIRDLPPRWYNLQFNVAFSCTAIMDLLRIMENCSRLPQRHPLLQAVGEERRREYSWAWKTFPAVQAAPNVSEVAEGRGELTIFDVEVYSDLRETVPLIRVVEIDIEMPKGADKVTIGE